MLARIANGDEQAYTAFFGNLDDIIRDFKGPALGTMMPQGRFANQWLKHMKSMLKSDKDYVKMLESHYKLMKGKKVVGI